MKFLLYLHTNAFEMKRTIGQIVETISQKAGKEETGSLEKNLKFFLLGVRAGKGSSIDFDMETEVPAEWQAHFFRQEKF